MLKKFVAIKNVGKFRACSAKGDVELRRTSLVFAENGRGKTTLCDIVRSLQSGDATFVLGRATLGATDPPVVEVLLDGGKATLKDGAWDLTFPNIAIYDSKFIHANVYAGEHVEHSQRRGLYGVIVGEQGVALAAKVDAFDDKIREANAEITKQQGEARPYLPAGVALDAFLALPKVDDVDGAVRTAEQSLAGLKQADSIAKREALGELALPSFPEGFQELLSKTVDDVSNEAERQIREHVAAHMSDADEAWLARGVVLLADSSCVFCGQPLRGVDLIVALKAKFSEAYERLVRDVQEMQESIEELASEAALLRLEQLTTKNELLCKFWVPFVTLAAPSIDLESAKRALTAVKTKAAQILEMKAARPLEKVATDEGLSTALSELSEVEQLVRDHNAAVVAANKLIAAKKAETKAGDATAAEMSLARLKAQQVRYTSNAALACEELVRARAAKESLAREKEKAREALDKHAAEVFGHCENRINKLLEGFGAGFRLGKTGGQYTGGKPSSTYQLVINEREVPLGDAETELGLPSFKNTLSAGDKSTLALAFFLVQLERNPRLADTVVVLDDPFTSQDRSRRACTQAHICKLSQKAKQVLVLSHDGAFLRSIWQAMDAGGVKALQLTRLGTNTTVTEWDVEEELQGEYFENHRLLREFQENGVGDPRSVARAIRPLLEGYLKMKLPGQFSAGKSLGNFIKAIREADASSPLDAARIVVDELADLNDYSKRYHHAENPGAETEPVDGSELETHARCTLNLVGGF